MARATWNGEMLAETIRPVLLEGNVYFRPEDLQDERPSRTRVWSACPRKGLARHRTARIRNDVAFWNGVQAGAQARLEAAPPGASADAGAASQPER